MHLFRDEIVPEIETSDNEHHSESNKDYNHEMEKDIIDDDHDSKERADKEDLRFFPLVLVKCVNEFQ